MPSLGILQGDNGCCILSCGAGCPVESIAAALGLTMRDLFPAKDAPPPEKTATPKKPKKVHPSIDAAAGAAAWMHSQRLNVPKESITFAGQWPYENADGKPIAYVLRHNLPTTDKEKAPKQFTPIHAKDTGWCLGDPKGHWPLYHLPEVIKAVTTHARLYFVEGEKTADAVRTLGLPCTTTAHGAKSPQMTDYRPLAGLAEAVLFPDNDDAGLTYTNAVAARILATAPLAQVRIVQLPGLPPKGDFVEWLDQRAGAPDDAILAELEDLIAAAPTLTAPALGPGAPAPAAEIADRPEVRITPDHHTVVETCTQILAKDCTLFQRVGTLVRTVRSAPKAVADDGSHGFYRPAGSLIIDNVTPANLRVRLTKNVFFTKFDKREREWMHAHPPDWLVHEILESKDWPGVPSLRGVSDAPVLRPDGSVWQTPGYDHSTGVVYQPPDDTSFPPIPSKPTAEHARAAVEQLREVVCDFPFESPEHFSAWIAALLTPLAVFTFEEPPPMFLMDANIRGAGKTRLAKLISRIITGRDMAVNVYAHESEEMKKVITGVAVAGDRMVLLDNVTGPFGNSALETVTTSRTWQGRILGENKNPTFDMSTVWFASGNNVQPIGDICRRLIPVRLNYTADDRPEQRTVFRHPDVLGWTAANRPRLLTAALTILSGYLPNRSTFDGPAPVGSFEGWSKTVRNACIWAGLADPYIAQAKMAEASDRDGDTLSQLLTSWVAYAAQWPKTQGGWLYISDVLAHLYPGPHSVAPDTQADRDMRAALELFKLTKEKVPSATTLGNRFNHFRNRPCKGLRLVRSEQKTNRGKAWRVLVVGSGEPHSDTENTELFAAAKVTRDAYDASPTPPCVNWQREKEKGSITEPHAILTAASGEEHHPRHASLEVSYQGEPDEMAERGVI